MEEKCHKASRTSEHSNPETPVHDGRGRIRRARTAVLLVVFLSIGGGLALNTGWGTLSSMGIDAVAYVCPLGALETMVAAHTAIPRSIITLVAAVVVIVLVGRVFCAWVCPVPPLERFFHPWKKGRAANRTYGGAQAICTDAPGDGTAVIETGLVSGGEEVMSSRTSGVNGAVEHAPSSARCASCDRSGRLMAVGGKRDGLQIDSRHGVLMGALVSSAIFGFPVFCLICPIGLTFATFIAIWRMFAEQEATWSLLAFPLILLIEIVLFRKWCHKICPMGAFMSLLSQKAPLFRPRVKDAACLRNSGVDCRVCVDICPEQLDPHIDHIPECTRCGLCAECCPEGAITLRAPLLP